MWETRAARVKSISKLSSLTKYDFVGLLDRICFHLTRGAIKTLYD